MLRLTALIHTQNDALRLGRALETLYPCDDILIVDRGSHDRTLEVAREYGVRVLTATSALPPGQFLDHEQWLLCLEPCESVSESLAASLYEWKLTQPQPTAFSIPVREETASGWAARRPEPRLIPALWPHWKERLPASDTMGVVLPTHVLEGGLLRFVFP